MKKLILVLTFLISSYFAQSQTAIDYTACDTASLRDNYIPAACSIEGKGVPTNLWMIQIGAYIRYINPGPGTIMIPSGNLYRYYVAAIFPSREEAKAYINQTKLREQYCDAIDVPFPFMDVIGFK